MSARLKRTRLGRVGAIAAAAIAVVLFQACLPQRDQATPGGTAAAQTVAAMPAPVAPDQLSRLSSAIQAADGGDWESVRSLRQFTDDPLVRRIMLWRLASDRSGPGTFEEVRLALQELDGWPGREAMRRRLEETIFDSALSASERVTLLRQDGGPLTGDGQVALALALNELGEREDARRIARQAYRDRALSGRAEASLMAAFSGAIGREDHAARIEGLLWRDKRGEAQALLSRISGADRLVAEARIALQQRRSRGLQAIVDRAAAVRPNDPGLLYDRARYIRRTGRPEEALNFAARADGADAPEVGRAALAEERLLYVRRALRMGQGRTAYRLATNHGLTRGVEFAEAEFLAGWVALRTLNDAATAERHFAALEAGVSTPVSKARAHYWRAQAQRALGQTEAAQRSLNAAAALGVTYYGQLAAQQLDRPPLLALPQTQAAITPALRASFENREVVRALRALAQVGDRQDFESIAYYLDDVLEDPAELELLAQMARDLGYDATAVRSAKAGLRRNVIATEASYPLVALPQAARGPGRPEPALVHAIIRQESEFDREARSPVGARGLMQLMPATARYVSRREGLAYDPEALTDPAYNTTLGSAYLGGLIDDFGGSYILAIAAYNAGPSRSQQWIADWGDPRTGAIDPVDWVELIPFEETRNYVQRVMENLQVYRHRLAGDQPTPITLREDLSRG